MFFYVILRVIVCLAGMKLICYDKCASLPTVNNSGADSYSFYGAMASILNICLMEFLSIVALTQ